MPLLPLPLVCIGGVLCLAPLVLYLSWLGALNRRPRPTVLPGPWDFVALAAGLSGFVVAGGGVVFAGVMSNARVLLRGNAAQAGGVWEREHVLWLVLAAGYLLGVAAWVAGGVVVRAGSLSVYNIARDRAEAAVGAALAAAGVPAERTGDLWADGTGGVEIRTFDGLRHLTVRLLGDDLRRRQEVERALRREFAATPADPDNPAAAWLTAVTFGLGMTVFAFAGLMVFLAVVAR